MIKNLLILSILLMRQALCTAGEKGEEVKRPKRFDPQGTTVLLGKVKNVYGLRLRKIISEKDRSPLEEIKIRGYQMEGDNPSFDLIVKREEAGEILTCDLEMIDKATNKKILIEKDKIGQVGDVCKGPVDDGRGTISVPVNITKKIGPKIVDHNVDIDKVDQGLVLCIKKQVEALKDSQFFKSFYRNTKLRFIAMDRSSLKNQDFDKRPHFYPEPKTSMALKELGYMGAIVVSLGKNWSCKYNTAQKIDEEILNVANNNLQISINHLGTEEKKSQIVKMREEEARKSEEQSATKLVPQSVNSVKQ